MWVEFKKKNKNVGHIVEYGFKMICVRELIVLFAILLMGDYNIIFK